MKQVRLERAGRLFCRIADVASPYVCTFLLITAGLRFNDHKWALAIFNLAGAYGWFLVWREGVRRDV